MPQEGAPANISLPASSPPLDPSECLLHVEQQMLFLEQEVASSSFSLITVLCLSIAGVCALLVMLAMTAV